MSEIANFIHQTIALINYYSFDVGEYTPKELIIKWSKKYKHFWLPLAVTEAIYQGRFKAISVEQILKLWERNGIPHYHFGEDFEALISHNIDDKVEEKIDLEELQNIKQEKLNNSQLPIKDNHHHYHHHHYTNFINIIVYQSPIQEFQPIEDYSHCYSQLKSLAQKKITNF